MADSFSMLLESAPFIVATIVRFGFGLGLMVVSHAANCEDYWVVYEGCTDINAAGAKINLSNCRK